MLEKIEDGAMVFLADGAEGVGAVRRVSRNGIVVYVEGAGEFSMPQSVILRVHDQKVMLDVRAVGKDFLNAVKHVGDLEDPALVG